MKIWSHSFSTRIDGNGKLVEQANRYFEALEVQGFSPKSIQTYAFVLMTFFRWLNEDWSRFKKFTQKDLLDWMVHLDRQQRKPSTINQRLCCARAFYFFCFGPTSTQFTRRQSDDSRSSPERDFVRLWRRPRISWRSAERDLAEFWQGS